MTIPKYALMEIETKLLVDNALLPNLGALPCARINDRYLDGGRLRLRAMTDAAAGTRIDQVALRYEFRGQRFSIDVFEGAHAGLVLCEVEAPSLEHLRALSFPAFAHSDVTAEPKYSGWNLAETDPA